MEKLKTKIENGQSEGKGIGEAIGNREQRTNKRHC
jgi:hypothetical protein